MKVLLISDGTFLARHSARRLVDLGHIVMDVRPDDFGGLERMASPTSAAFSEQVDAHAYDRVLCLVGKGALTASASTSPMASLIERATEVAQSHRARFVLASALPRAAAGRETLLALEQQVARAVWHHGLDGGVCRLEGLYGSHAEASERHALLGPLVAAGIAATTAQVAAPLDALHWPLHVRDAVDGLVAMLHRGGPTRVRFAGATPYRTRDLLATVEAVLGVPMTLETDYLDERRGTHPPHIGDARRLLRWRPRVGLFAGVEEQAFSEVTRVES
jgi:hypothetical protein